MRRRAVPDQQDALPLAGVLARELIEESLDTDGIESRQDEPEDAPRAGLGRREEPEPFVALIHFGEGALTPWRPHAPQDRLEPEASFVGAPDFNGGGGMRFSQGLGLAL
jgi:hypothetical protein